VDREFLLGFIKIHILYHASKEPIYGVGIKNEFYSNQRACKFYKGGDV